MDISYMRRFESSVYHFIEKQLEIIEQLYVTQKFPSLWHVYSLCWYQLYNTDSWLVTFTNKLEDSNTLFTQRAAFTKSES